MGRSRQISEQDEWTIVSMYEDGDSIYKIAAQVECAPQTVHKILVRRGVVMRTRGGRMRRSLTKRERQRVVSQYMRRVRVADIARELKTSLGTIYDTLRDEQVSLRGQGQQPHLPTAAERRAILRRYDAGQGIERIAADLHHGFQTIKRILQEAGIQPPAGPRRGPDSPGWKGGRIYYGPEVNGSRYIAVWVAEDDPMREMRSRDGYVPESRLVIARHLGRPLTKHETVHHINGQRDDNRLENLQLRNGNHGRGIVMRCMDCGSANVDAVRLGDTGNVSRVRLGDVDDAF